MPGEPELRNERKFAETGVPLPANVVDDIRNVAEGAGVEMPTLSPSPLG